MRKQKQNESRSKMSRSTKPVIKEDPSKYDVDLISDAMTVGATAVSLSAIREQKDRRESLDVPSPFVDRIVTALIVSVDIASDRVMSFITQDIINVLYTLNNIIKAYGAVTLADVIGVVKGLVMIPTTSNTGLVDPDIGMSRSELETLWFASVDAADSYSLLWSGIATPVVIATPTITSTTEANGEHVRQVAGRTPYEFYLAEPGKSPFVVYNDAGVNDPVKGYYIPTYV